MPRRSKSVPSYRKHRASGQAVVTINGRDYYLGPHGTRASKSEYDRLIGEWLASGRSETFGKESASITVAKLLLAYLTHAKAYYGSGSRGEFANMRNAVRPLKRLYSRHFAHEFGALEFKAVRQCFVEAGNCRSHVNASARRVIRVFRWGAAEGLIPAFVPATLAMIPGLRRGRTEAPEGKKVTPVALEVVRATQQFMSQIVRDMTELQRLTGMRPGELVILRPCDVDRENEIWEYRPSDHKTAHCEKDRVVYLGPVAKEILRPYLSRESNAYCFSPDEAAVQSRKRRSHLRRTPLSCGNRPGSNRKRVPQRRPGKRYSTNTYRSAVYRACDSAFPPEGDLARQPAETRVAWRARLNPQQIAELHQWRKRHRWSVNQLRHSLATHVRREFGVDVAGVILGHANCNTTLVYAEKDRATAIEVMKHIG